MATCTYGAALAAFADSRGADAAVTFGTTVLTWSELEARSSAAAHRLAAYGVSAGDVVAFAGPSHPDQLVLTFGVWKLGAIPFAVPGGRSRDEMDALVGLAEPVLLVDFADSRSGVPSATAAELAASPDTSTPSAALPDVISPSMRIGSSGGSTGRPKLIVLDLPPIVNSARPWPPGMRANGTQVMALNLTDGAGFTMATQALGTGSHLVLAADQSPHAVLALASEHAATWMMLTPTVMLELYKAGAADPARYDLSSLNICSSGGGVAPWLKQAWIDWLDPGRVWEFYAGTDGRGSTSIDGADWLRHRGSVGRADRGCEVAILDNHGASVPAGTHGNVYLRDISDRRHFHYLGAAIETLDGGWETLGDVGWLDPDGYLYLLDRAKDVISTGSGPVYPLQIEWMLEKCAAVRSAIAIGLPDGTGNETIHAIVDTDGAPLAEDEIRRFAADALPADLVPRSFELTSERLRDRAGKARRTQLRQERLDRV